MPDLPEFTPRAQARSADHCPVCLGRPKLLADGGCTDAWLCTACGHLFVTILPTEDELAETYKDYGYDNLELATPGFLNGILTEVAATFDSYRISGRLLDVGFGSAGLLKACRERGWEAYGVERSPAAVRRARAQGIDTVILGEFTTAPLEPGSFDVIVMTELLEHVLDPLSFLTRAAELLRPGGLFYATTPHSRGVSGRVLGSSWSVVRPPEHLQLFSLTSMRLSLARAGFRKPNVYTQGLLPHELLAKFKRSIFRSSPSTSEGRVVLSYRLNESLMRRTHGRLLKRTANAVLRAVRLGDSLRVGAER